MLSVLEDMIPAKYRKYVVYILIPLGVVVYGVWKASDGNWAAFWPALVPAIIGWLVAAPNTDTSEDSLVSPFDPADQPDVLDGIKAVPNPTADEVSAATANAAGTFEVEQ